MGVSPTLSRNLLTREKGRLPKNPPLADNGLGCADSIIKWRGFVIIFFLARAGRPHKIKASGRSCSLSKLMILSVKISQPCPRCEFAACALTVQTVFKSKTPCSAQDFKQPLFGIVQPKSSRSSLKIFKSDGGGGTSGKTEKLKPCACPGS